MEVDGLKNHDLLVAGITPKYTYGTQENYTEWKSRIKEIFF